MLANRQVIYDDLKCPVLSTAATALKEPKQTYIIASTSV